MKRSYRALRGAALAGLLIFAAGCTTAPSPLAATGAVADASLHPHGPFPGLHYRDGGTARLTSAPSPASAALPGANDLLAAGAVVLAAGDTGIWRSDDGGATWRQLVGGFRAWSIAVIPGGGYAVLGALPQQVNVVAAPVLATSANGIGWRTRRIQATGASQRPFGYGYRFALDGLGATTDGGLTWRARWRTPVENGPDSDDPVLRLDMVSAERGWAVTGGCVLGQNGPCPGTVYATVDGGYQWRRTSQRAIAIASLWSRRSDPAQRRSR